MAAALDQRLVAVALALEAVALAQGLVATALAQASVARTSSAAQAAVPSLTLHTLSNNPRPRFHMAATITPNKTSQFTVAVTNTMKHLA